MKNIQVLKVTYEKHSQFWQRDSSPIIQGAQISPLSLDNLLIIPFVPFNPIPSLTSSLPSSSSAFEITIYSPLGPQAVFLPSTVSFLLSFTVSLKTESSSSFPHATSQTKWLCDSFLIISGSVQEIPSAAVLWYDSCLSFPVLPILTGFSFPHSFLLKKKNFPTLSYLYPHDQCSPSWTKEVRGHKMPWALFYAE